MQRYGSSLAGKIAIVTGSTSGIGLGIARAFAGAGMNVMLNGLGDNHEIDETRLALNAEFGITAGYSAADILCTEAAASITGAALPVEGGWTAQ